MTQDQQQDGVNRSTIHIKSVLFINRVTTQKSKMATAAMRRVLFLLSFQACFMQILTGETIDNGETLQRVRRAAVNPAAFNIGYQDADVDKIAAVNSPQFIQKNQQPQQAQHPFGNDGLQGDNVPPQPANHPQQPAILPQQHANLPVQPGMQGYQANIQPQVNQAFPPHNVNPIGMGNAGQQRQMKLKNIMLVEQPQCEEDIRRLCSATLMRNNFAILDCLQVDLEDDELVSEPCQHIIWEYKKNLTLDGRFEAAGSDVCQQEFSQLPECASLEPGSGKRIPCMIEHMANITGPCKQYLNKMAKIVFGDYHYVWHFMEDCGPEVTKFQCGRLDNGNEDENGEKLHSQGRTIVCLAKVVGKLSTQCKKQVLHVAELQADDYHLDRPLYYACRDAREKFCEKVHAGGGKVFECLFKHKNDLGMAPECTRMLVVRQQLIAEDVKVEKTFFLACQEDIVKYRCFTGSEHDADRSRILRCLENALKKGLQLKNQCVAEMTELRKSFMSDYEINPEIVMKCRAEIDYFCEGGRLHGGHTLHCLMENAQKKLRNHMFSHECKEALEGLLLDADVAENIQVDRILAEACEPVIQTVCKNAGTHGVINCLMEKIDHELMTDDCEDRLLEIQYFIVRDFRLSPQFYRMCHADAMKYCGASQDWFDVTRASVDNSPEIFSCLYRHIKDEEDSGEISKPCLYEVRYAMRMRAKRVNLEPEIEDACITSLATYCSNLEAYGKDAEISCLQDNYEDLDDDCQDAIGKFTEDEDEDLELDTILMRACTPMIKKFCEALLDHDADASEVMDCLIEHKHHRDMNTKCAAGVEHHQLIQLKDFKFTHKFKEACKESVITHCPNMNKKQEIIVCLSAIVRDDILKDSDHRVENKCQQQLRVEVLRRGENINHDPELKKACEDDMKRLCKTKHAGDAQMIECLKSHQPELTQQCHILLFKREKTETNLGDYSLFHVCKTMITSYCSVAAAEDVLDCLKRNRNMDSFDAKCRALVMKRQLQEAKDYRLNPSLAKACRRDIPKYCSNIVQNDNEELEGKIINCLKIFFIKKKLTRDCHAEIRSLIKETALNINLDPVLVKACERQIKDLCSKQLSQHEEQANRVEFAQTLNEGDPIEECLKQKLFERKIPQESQCGREVRRLVEESHVDVNMDPQLHIACQDDLVQFCGDIDRGEGRQMARLLIALEEYPSKMKSKCSSLLSQRKRLWEYATKIAPPESFGEVGQQILESPAKAYSHGVLVTIVGVIFIVGLTCGRVTKRVTAKMKNNSIM